MRWLSALIIMLAVGTLQARVSRQWTENRILDNSSMAWTIPVKASTVTIETCVAMKGPKDTRGVDPCRWQLTLALVDGSRHEIIVGWGNTDFGDFSDSRYLEVTGVQSDPVRFTGGVDLYSGDNTVVVESHSPGNAKVYIGNDVMDYVGEINLSSPICEVAVGTSGRLELAIMSIECEIPWNLDSGLDADRLAAACEPGQSAPLGLWHYFDRDNDAAYARPGGTYSLAVVPDPEQADCFLILYIDGARVNASKWEPGMIKGRLTPTKFAGRYRLEWWDAGMTLIHDEANAIVEPDMLTLNFPLLHSQLRYSR